MTDAILVFNAGSSSIKFAAYDVATVEAGQSPSIAGNVSGIGGQAILTVQHGSESQAVTTTLEHGATSHDQAWGAVLATLQKELSNWTIIAVGHRIVHGGQAFTDPTVINSAVYDELERLTPLAPGHQPHNLAGVRHAQTNWPNATHVACFDTAFHRSQPRLAQLFSLPRAYADQGVIRYGFHGLSYQYIAETAPNVIGDAARGRLIVAHLGHGVSMCAMRYGRSIATTMGFTALDGLPMGKRCGAIDPGVLLHLLQTEDMSVSDLSDLLYKKSGLLGLSGMSDDMRALEASDHPHAKEAIDYFVHRCVGEIGALTAQLGGLDALVFTAGIGENSARVRGQILERLNWLGVALDNAANAASDQKISANATGPSAWVIATNEELMIARHSVQIATQGC